MSGYRRHQRERAIRRRVDVFTAVEGHAPWKPAGAYAKRSPFDCGNPHCPYCRRPRYGKRERRQGREEAMA